MASRSSPIAHRRRLSIELLELRQQAGLTAVEAAKRAGFPAASKISNIEQHKWKIPRHGDVAALLDVYGVTDPARRDELLLLAAQAGDRPWWHGIAHITPTYDTYIGLEAAARTLWGFKSGTVPELLQTPAYTRAVLLDQTPSMSEREVEERIHVFGVRQLNLTEGSDPVDLWAILEEAVLRRPIGGAAVMAEQLDHIAKIAVLGNVTLQVLPLDRPHAPPAAPFTIIQFPNPTDPAAAYLETADKSLWVDDKAAIEGLLARFAWLMGLSLSADETVTMLSEIAAGLRTRARSEASHGTQQR
ncbi:MAG: hypothetical protein QOE54_2201 [Streptosporangiaceae bacterium]|jgi:transcriptional regulator with XRE-family HTH domain|nr:transcriptional regulator [Streptosporangiaceae bacterium]MDX6429835.1 hypothetical protein [Streptosporangiaceae bacterium]